MIEVDVKGLSCPIPVVKTKKVMEENPKATISVLINSNVAKENVTRLAKSKKYSVKVEEAGAEEFNLVLKPSA